MDKLRSGAAWWPFQDNVWIDDGLKKTKSTLFDEILDRIDPMASCYSAEMRKMAINHLKEKLIEFVASDMGQRHFGNDIALRVLKMDPKAVSHVAEFLMT